MKMTFRWYGEEDSIPLSFIKQIPGMDGVVSAIYDIPVGEVWPMDKILKLKETIQNHNLSFEVVERVPVHEAIKLGLDTKDRYIENYKQNIINLSKADIKVICYNFTPVFDWTRTDLNYKNIDDSISLVYFQDTLKKMNPLTGELHLPGWDTSYTKVSELFEQYKQCDEEKFGKT